MTKEKRKGIPVYETTYNQLSYIKDHHRCSITYAAQMLIEKEYKRLKKLEEKD